MDENLNRLLSNMSDEDSNDTVISVSSTSSTSSFRSSLSSSSSSEAVPSKKQKLMNEGIVEKLNEIMKLEVGDNDKVYKIKELLKQYTEQN